MNAVFPEPIERFRTDYAAYRAGEGRAHRGDELCRLPYLKSGPLAREWAVRARTFEAFVRRIVSPMGQDRSLDVLDLGAGNGWLSWRLAARGHRCIAIDVRDDTIDGLGAAEDLRRLVAFDCVVASFEALPLAGRSADLAVFNASLHYATDLAATMAETIRCLQPGGVIAVLDSPFYRNAADGGAMVREKRALAHAGRLLALDCIEYLTRERLERASGLAWRCHRVRYPLWYELRPLAARLHGRRHPSRFDLWTAAVR